jgi:hypothetical protein
VTTTTTWELVEPADGTPPYVRALEANIRRLEPLDAPDPEGVERRQGERRQSGLAELDQRLSSVEVLPGEDRHDKVRRSFMKALLIPFAGALSLHAVRVLKGLTLLYSSLAA